MIGSTGHLGWAPSIHAAFGLRVRCHFPLPELPELPVTAAVGAIDLDVSLASIADVRAAFSGPLDPPRVDVKRLGDGCRYVTERGSDGDYRIEYGDRASFHLTADGRRLRCAAVDPDEPSWRRFLLDSGLATAALVHGFEALHAGAFDHTAGVVAIVAGEGGGKSVLLAEMIRRGNLLVCDDVLMLFRVDGLVPIAQPGPPLMNLPATLPDGTPADRHGRVLATFEDECWVAVDQPASTARPVAAVVLLDRGIHGAVAIERLPSSPVELLRHSLMSGRAPDRLARRFALFTDMAVAVPLWRLCGPAHAPASELADVLELALGRAPAALR